MRVLRARWWMLAALLAVAPACSDDDSDGGGDGGASDAGDDRGRDTGGNNDTGISDTQSDTPLLDQNVGDNGGGDTGTFECSQIGTAQNVGQQCTGNDQCGTGGGACLTMTEGQPGTCFQVCVPGQCEDPCTGDEACLTLVDENNNPVPITPGGPNAGVCSVPPAGTQGAYDACGEGVGGCEQGLDCLGLTGLDGAPFCSPQCTGQGSACPSAGDIAGTCALGQTQGNITNCALLCDDANAGTGEGCPQGMTCVDTGQGTGICLHPAE